MSRKRPPTPKPNRDTSDPSTAAQFERAMAPLTDLAIYVGEVRGVALLTTRAIGVLSRAPEMDDAMNELFEDISKDNATEPKRSSAIAFRLALEDDAKLAADQIAKGFPLLYSHSCITLWSALETAILDLAAVWIANNPELLTSEAVQSLKISLSDYLACEEADRARFVAVKLDEGKGRLERGITRFEKLLYSVGLGGTFGDATGATFWELQHVRNVVAHQRGIADARFIQGCPKFGATKGAPILITHGHLRRYVAAIRSYAIDLLIRVRLEYGLPAIPDTAAAIIKTASAGPKPST